MVSLLYLRCGIMTPNSSESVDRHRSENIIKATVKRFLRDVLKLSMRNVPKGPHITRYVMYECILRSVEKLQKGDALSIGHSSSLTLALCSDSTRTFHANLPDQNWLYLPYKSNTFDLVVSDQVLEHVQGDPQQAIDESWRVTKLGGLVVCTSCLVNGIHNHPVDLWRFTPEGLKFLHRGFSEIIECGGWGNRWVSVLDWLNLRYEPIPTVAWHPLHHVIRINDPLNPIVTWVVARK
jgi:SAM-dependent methyltransferase